MTTHAVPLTDAILDIEQAAARLHTSPETVRRWIKQRKLRASKPGAKWLIRESAIYELLRASESSS